MYSLADRLMIEELKTLVKSKLAEQLPVGFDPNTYPHVIHDIQVNTRKRPRSTRLHSGIHHGQHHGTEGRRRSRQSYGFSSRPGEIRSTIFV